jgi:hypothetical protein
MWFSGHVLLYPYHATSLIFIAKTNIFLLKVKQKYLKRVEHSNPLQRINIGA